MARQSLAAQTGLIAADFKLPTVFQAPSQKVEGRYIAPYITFAHPKRQDEWGKIVSKFGTPDEGDMFLIMKDEIIPLPEVKMGWMCHQQYWCTTNPAGEVLQVSFVEEPHPFKEHIEGVSLVYVNDERIVPANIQFRTTKCPAGKMLADTLEAAATDDWMSRGPAYVETMQVPQPFFRFYGVVSLGPQRTSKSSGLTYRTTQCTIEPTTLPEFRLIKAFAENPETYKQLQDAADRFTSRLSELKKKVK